VAALRCGKAVQIHCSFVVCTASCTACILEKDKKTNKTMPINNTGLCYCQHADVTISVRKNAENARFQIRDFKVDFLKVFKKYWGGIAQERPLEIMAVGGSLRYCIANDGELKHVVLLSRGNLGSETNTPICGGDATENKMVWTL